MTHRVSVRDGHLEAVSVKLASKASREEVETTLRDFKSPIDELQLPTAPRPVMLVENHPQRPQPRLDRDRGQGMAVIVGPVSPCAVLDYKFRVLSHNTIRGAAGAAIFNAELMYKRKGLIGWKRSQSMKSYTQIPPGTQILIGRAARRGVVCSNARSARSSKAGRMRKSFRRSSTTTTSSSRAWGRVTKNRSTDSSIAMETSWRFGPEFTSLVAKTVATRLGVFTETHPAVLLRRSLEVRKTQRRKAARVRADRNRAVRRQQARAPMSRSC